MKMKLIFDMYDFDKDGFISKEDVVLMLSHVPIEKLGTGVHAHKEGRITQGGMGTEDYMDRAESQKELSRLVEICFSEKVKLALEDFKSITENVSSEMFLCLFSLLRTKFPSLVQFKRYEQGLKIKSDVLLRSPTTGRRLAAPKVLSKFAPIAQLVKFSTPRIESRALHITKASDAESEPAEEIKGLTAQKPYLSKIAPKPKSGFAPTGHVLESPIGPAVRLANTKLKAQDVTNSPTPFLAGHGSDTPTLFCECGKTIIDFNKLQCPDCIAKQNDAKCEGYLYIKRKTVKKYWYCTDKKEIYCILPSKSIKIGYEKKDGAAHKSMRSLTGCFIREDEPEKIEEQQYFPFTLVFSQIKSKKYYAANKEDFKMWVSAIKKIVGYANLLDYYELKVRNRV